MSLPIALSGGGCRATLLGVGALRYVADTGAPWTTTADLATLASDGRIPLGGPVV